MSATTSTAVKSQGFLEHVDSGRKNLRKLYKQDQDRLKQVIVKEFTNPLIVFMTNASKPEEQIYDLNTHQFRKIEADDSQTKAGKKDYQKEYRDFLANRVSVIAQQFVGDAQDKQESVHQYLLYKLGVGNFSSTEEFIENGKATLHTAHKNLAKVLTKIHDGKFLSGKEKTQKREPAAVELKESEEQVEEKNEVPAPLHVGQLEVEQPIDLTSDDAGEQAALFEEELEERDTVKTPLPSEEENQAEAEHPTGQTRESLTQSVLIEQESDDDADSSSDEASLSGSSEASSTEDESTVVANGAKRKRVDDDNVSSDDDLDISQDNKGGFPFPPPTDQPMDIDANAAQDNVEVQLKPGSPMEIDSDVDVDVVVTEQALQQNEEVASDAESTEETEAQTPPEKKPLTGLAGFFVRMGRGIESFFISIFNWFKKLFS